MTEQRAINMHGSQISHGIVKPDDFINDALNRITTGYTPSMIRIFALDAALDPVKTYFWFSTMPDNMFTGDAMLDTVVATTEKGFVLNGLGLVTLEQTAEGFIWECYGCDNDGSYLTDMHPDPVDAGAAMDPVDPYLPTIYSDVTDIKINSAASDVVTEIDNTLLTIDVVAAATAADLLGELESTNGAFQAYNIYADDTGAPDLAAEKTDTDALVSTDWLVVTAADGETTANYEITVAS